jgi:hypothetical protein
LIACAFTAPTQISTAWSLQRAEVVSAAYTVSIPAGFDTGVAIPSSWATMVSAIDPVALSVFHSTGCAILDRFLDDHVVADLIDSIESLPSDQFADRKRRGVVFARRNLLNHDFIQLLLQRPEITDLVTAIAADAIPVRALLFDKTGAANWTVPWHQDRSIMVARRIDVAGFGPWSVKGGIVHVQPPVEVLRQMLTIRLHLDSCNDDNGPLRVIEGTHHRILEPSEIDAVVASQEVLECTTSAGGLVIMRPLILHSSTPAKAPTHRRIIHIEFGPRDLPFPLKWAHAAKS